MIRYIVSLIIGILPETLYFTFFLIYTKNIKEKKIKLFLLLGLTYICLVFIIPYKLIFYTLFVFVVYGILKLLYQDKADKVDIFVFSFSTAYVSLISFVCFSLFDKSLNNYETLFIIDRILLVVPFLFKKYFNKIYLKYRLFWNRDKHKDDSTEKKKRPKAISLRNASLIAINLIIVLMNYYFILMLEFLERR